jgi:cobalt/nickel transport system ATP-binding protein
MTSVQNKLPLFSVQNITYAYEGSGTALDAVSFDLFAGETLVLLGSNGCGKSTLLKLLDGLYFAAAGKILYQDEELSEERFRDEAFNGQFRREVGLVFQDSDVQLFLPSVTDELAFAPLQMDLQGDEVRRRVEAALTTLRIEGLRERAPHQLSSGEKKRVALASLLTLDPAVWLLDEPSAGLDPRSVAWLTSFIREQAALGKTMVLATHDLQLTREVADRICLLNEAHQVELVGRPSEILEQTELLRSANLL